MFSLSFCTAYSFFSVIRCAYHSALCASIHFCNVLFFHGPPSLLHNWAPYSNKRWSYYDQWCGGCHSVGCNQKMCNFIRTEQIKVDLVCHDLMMIVIWYMHRHTYQQAIHIDFTQYERDRMWPMSKCKWPINIHWTMNDRFRLCVSVLFIWNGRACRLASAEPPSIYMRKIVN